MTIARRAGAWLIVMTLVVALLEISVSWPVIVVGCIGALIFVVAEVDEIRELRRSKVA